MRIPGLACLMFISAEIAKVQMCESHEAACSLKLLSRILCEDEANQAGSEAPVPAIGAPVQSLRHIQTLDTQLCNILSWDPTGPS